MGMISYLSDISIFIRPNSQVQIIQNKRKSKSNMKYENYFIQNGEFKSKEIEKKKIGESEGEVESELEHGVSFNLSLSLAERLEREKVILPHLDRRTEAKIEI